MPVVDVVPGVEFRANYTPLRMRVLASLMDMPPNNVFFVDSTSSARGGADVVGNGTKANPFLTWDFAHNQCVANRGDMIVLMPGHVETANVASFITHDTAGVRVLALGNGANRATITFNGVTGASIVISAPNVKIWGVRGVAGLDGLTNPFHVQAADCELDIDWLDGSATVEAARAILTTAAADRFVWNLRYYGFTTGDAVVNAVRLVGCNGGRGYVDAYGVCSTAWVEFATTACSDIRVTGQMFTQGITNGSRNVVDTVTGSTWHADIFDASAGAKMTGGSGAALAIDDMTAITDALYGTAGIASFPNAAVPANNVSLAEVLRDVWAVLNGTAAGENGVQTWPAAAAYGNNVSMAEVLAYIQDGTRRGTGTSLAANESLADVLYATNGIVTFPAAALPANGVSIAEVLREVYDQADKAVTNTTGTLVNGTTLFTIAGGPIEILSLVARCVTGNDATASTLQWSADPTDGAAATFSGASASLANALAGATVVLQGTTLATAPLVNTSGVGLGQQVTNGIIVGAGIITSVVGVGSTTGTWQHHLRYRPLSRGVTVS